MIKQIALVALGGGVGSALRYLVSVWSSKQLHGVFPWGTFVVNITGCLLIGFLFGLITRFDLVDNELRLLLIVGVCGGYTTFSAFSVENLRLIESGNYMLFILYVITSVLLGVIAVLGGNALSKIIVQ